MAWPRADGDRRERVAEVLRAWCFPRFVVKIQPCPAARLLAGLELQRPHVVECELRVVAECAGACIARREHCSVENRFGAARLAGFRKAACLIGVEGLDVAPQAHALGHVFQHLALRRGRVMLAKRAAQRRPRKRVRQRGVTRHARGVVIARSGRSRQPPPLTPVEIGGGRFGVPRGGILRSGESGGHTHRENNCLHRLNSERRTTIASVAWLIVAGAVSKLLAMIAKTSGSPSAELTYPDRLRTLVMEPVFARALPSARVAFMRVRRPSPPATGRLASNGALSFASRSTWTRIVTSASGGT